MARDPQDLRSSEGSRAGTFVGREREVAELLGGLEEAISGEGRLFLLSGEAGIGKSRLADEIATLARRRGAPVLWGRCWEAGGAPAYWPWVQSLRTYIRSAGVESWVAQMGAGAPFIAQMMPELRELQPEIPPSPPLDPDAARFRLFDATATFLVDASIVQPLVVLFDDLQAADEPSMLLLSFVARQLTESRILMVCTYRDSDVSDDHPLASSLTELARAPATRRLHLEGLGVGDVGPFIEATTGVPVSDPVVAAIHDRTEGNPLFVGELSRLLASEGRLAQQDLPATRSVVPIGVRDVIGRRLEQLSPGCVDVLAVASVVGRQFEVEILRRATGRSLEDVLEILEEAARSRIVQGGTGATDQLRFSHVVLRDVIYDRLPAARRIELHRVVAEVLVTLSDRDPGPYLAAIAHQFFEAAPGGDAPKAVAYAREAAERAVGLLAYEEAVRLYGMALRALDLGGRVEDETRCELLVARGDAQARSGDDAGSRETFLDAAALSKRLGLPELLGRAALGYGGRFVWARGSVDLKVVPLLREALDALPEEDSALRVRILSRLSGALRDDHDPAPRSRLSREAVEMARRIGDQAALAYALDSHWVAIYAPDNSAERLSIGTELIEAAQAAGDLERAVDGHVCRFAALLETGDMPLAHVELAEMARAAAELRQPAQVWEESVNQALVSLFEGRFGEAARWIGTAATAGERGEYQSKLSLITQTFALRREQGRVDEVREAVARVAARYEARPVFRCLLATVYADLDDRAEAERIFETFAAGDFATLPRDTEWMLGMALLAETAAFLGDVERSSTLYGLLVPWRDLVVFDPNEFSMGSVSRYLGLLARTMSRWDEASSHFEAALEVNGRMGGRPWVAHTQHDYARMLSSRDGPGDGELAAGLLRDAIATCRNLGMPALERHASALLEQLDGGPPEPDPRSEKGGASVFRREGEYWTIAHEGDAFRLKDSKGLRYLARLLAQPDREIHALDLASEGGAGPSARSDPAMAEPGDTGEVLDPQARAAYRGRLADLQEDLDEAEAMGDAERAGRAREEIEFVARELGAATGLGGRSRRAGSAAERARVNVTKAIKSALRRIGEHSPSLERHLDRTVVTGTFCSYAPDPHAAPRWQT